MRNLLDEAQLAAAKASQNPRQFTESNRLLEEALDQQRYQDLDSEAEDLFDMDPVEREAYIGKEKQDMMTMMMIECFG